jgi:hypothetical protein
MRRGAEEEDDGADGLEVDGDDGKDGCGPRGLLEFEAE